MIRFNVDAIIKNKEGARHSFGPHTLLDEVVDGAYKLVVYTNGKRTQTSFPIVELPIKGTIKHPIPVDKRIRFYIVARREAIDTSITTRRPKNLAQRIL